MRFAPLSTSRAASLLTLVLAMFAFSEIQADVVNPENKPGFMKRLFGAGEKPTPTPTPTEVKEAPKAKPATPGPKPKVTTIKPKSGSSSKSSSSTAKKPAPAVVKTEKKSEEPVAKKVESEKPAPEPEKKMAESATKKEGDGEFGADDDDKQTVEVKPQQVTPNSPLPSSQSAGWKIVKVNGRDYVTGDSIHQFYRFSTYKVEGTHVWFKSNNLILKAQMGAQEILINNIKFILSFPVLDSGGKALFSRLDLCKLIDPVLRPTYISDGEYFDTVVLDAGHGGHDAGARGIYGYEKDFALKMAGSVREALQRKGFKVIMTRSTDTFITLGGRVAIANATPKSIFLSLHFNSGGSAATGIETFALTPQGSSATLERGGGFNYNGTTGNSHDSANIALATAVHAMVISRFKFVDRGIKRAQWSVLTGCKRPGILFEGGFVTNGNECRLIASDTYRQSVSVAIADAISNYRLAIKGANTNANRR
ncbi:MAG: N-acetylmuramoyl-L-alanine amidase [Verrucomicrobia bacterium]|nr:N-acetylmuramoyl-L-alanine amidase [Verrucomicrobiota bacterium]